MLGAIALISLPAILVLVRRDELTDAVNKTTGAEPRVRARRRELTVIAENDEHQPRRYTMSTINDLSNRTTVVVGASRGLGRGIATALAQAGAPVIAVARTAAPLAELAGGVRGIQPVVADAADATAPDVLLRPV